MSDRTDDLLKRVPPQNIEAEQSVIGAVLLENESFHEVSDLVAAHDFYRETHRAIFQAIAELIAGNQPADAITLTEKLRSKGVLEQVGGPAYIAELADSVPTAANVAHYARIVREKSVLRRLISDARDIETRASEPGADAVSILEEAEASIFQIAERRARSSFVGSKSLVRDSLLEIDRLAEHKGEISGLPSGIDLLDALTSGFHPGQLIVIGARPSVGKSALALNIAMHNALKAARQVSTAFLSLEMSKDEIMFRMLVAESGVSSTKLRAGFLRDNDFKLLAQAAERIEAGAEVHIDDAADLTPGQLRSKCRRIFRERKNIGAVVVDYLQLAQSATRAERRELEVAELSRALKGLAKELDVPVIALSQLNRQVEMRSNKRPVLSDLRESGAIEQDADVVIFIYRDEMYDDQSQEKGIAELIVAKNRNGARTTVRAAYRAELMRFENIGATWTPDAQTNGHIDGARDYRGDG
jgi:replicative DNA helicase